MVSIRFTGLDDLRKNFSNFPQLVEKIVGSALGKSIAMVETEAKRRTPVRTGLLQSSIGGEGGYSFVRGLTAGVGTNVKYAWFVETNKKSKHNVGEWGYMEKGAKASESFIVKKMEEAMKEIANQLTK